MQNQLGLSGEKIVEKVYPHLLHHVGLIPKLSAICERLSRHYLSFVLR